MLKPQWFQILLSLADRPRHGLAIRDEVLARTDDEMHLWPATLYRSLQKLQDKGMIAETDAPDDEEVSAGQPRFYGLTDAGRAELRREVERLRSYVADARARGLEG